VRTPARVLLVGAFGHGQWHLANLRRLSDAGIARLVGVCDLRPVPAAAFGLDADVPQYTLLDTALDLLRPDVTIVVTPIQTHVDLALTAMRAGSHVLLEKPPAPSLADYQRLVRGAAATGVACQVGFQSLGSGALDHARAIIESGRLGEVRGIGGAGNWVRDSGYYARAAWAGRRRLGGQPVVDGALTNPFAHALASALSLDGAAAVSDVETELFHAHPIEADDTSCLRLRTDRGTVVTMATTLCAAEQRPPYLVVHGSAGRLVLWYSRDELRISVAGEESTRIHPRTDLLTNLIEHVRGTGTPLRVPLGSISAFMEVVEAVRLAPDPRPVPRSEQDVWHENGLERRVIRGVDGVVTRSAETLRLFSELGVPWASGNREAVS
jgi:predicted dehydrogenase